MGLEANGDGSMDGSDTMVNIHIFLLALLRAAFKTLERLTSALHAVQTMRPFAETFVKSYHERPAHSL
jgi:hypothetical protein